MSRVTRMSLPWTTVYCTSTSAIFVPATAYMRAGDVGKARVAFEMRAPLNDPNVSAAYQTANVEGTPDTPATALGSYVTAEGNTYPTFTDISAAAEQKQLIRFGRLVKNGNGSSLSLARVGGVLEIIACP